MEQKVRENINSMLTGINNISAGYAGETIKSLAVESVQERAIEMGLGFICTSTMSINAGSTKYFTITVPATHTVTLFNFFATAGSAVLSKFELFEGVTITEATGTQTATWNVNINRSSTNTAETVYLENPTITNEGTKIMEVFTGLSGYVVTGNPSLQLKSDTSYAFKLHNTSGSAVSYNIYFQTFELAVGD